MYEIEWLKWKQTKKYTITQTIPKENLLNICTSIKCKTNEKKYTKFFPFEMVRNI